MDLRSPAAELVRRLWNSRAGILRAEDRHDPVRFVLEGHTGRPVLPVARTLFDSQDIALSIPDDRPGSLELLVVLHRLDPQRDEACDRWRACFGRPDVPLWAALACETARAGATIVDGSELMVPNPLAPGEGALCRAVNADAGMRTRLAVRAGAPEGDEPRVVGVDAWGIDLASAIGLLRVSFPTIAPTPALAQAAIEALAAPGTDTGRP